MVTTVLLSNIDALLGFENPTSNVSFNSSKVSSFNGILSVVKVFPGGI